MHKRLSLTLLGLILALATAPVCAAEARDAAVYRGWIEEMKAAERGPFERIRWFCNDGTVLPPKAYACEPHGGGHQHGEWSDRTVELRAAGLPGSPTCWPGCNPDDFLADPEVGDASRRC